MLLDLGDELLGRVLEAALTSNLGACHRLLSTLCHRSDKFCAHMMGALTEHQTCLSPQALCGLLAHRAASPAVPLRQLELYGCGFSLVPLVADLAHLEVLRLPCSAGQPGLLEQLDGRRLTVQSRNNAAAADAPSPPSRRHEPAAVTWPCAALRRIGRGGQRVPRPAPPC